MDANVKRITKIFITAASWSALVFGTVEVGGVLISAVWATVEWYHGNASAKAGWEGFPIMMILLTIPALFLAVVTFLTTMAYSIAKGPGRLPFSKR